jgi:type II secretory pathway component PulF
MATAPAQVAVPSRLGLAFWLIAGVAAFFSFRLAFIGSFVVPSYVATFDAFGTDLPWTTQLVLDTSAWWWLAPALAAALWAYSLLGRARLQYRLHLMLAFVVLGTASMVTLRFAAMALLAPIAGLDPV